MSIPIFFPSGAAVPAPPVTPASATPAGRGSRLLSARRKPWPYDLVVDTDDGAGGVGMMLQPAGEKGNGPLFTATRAKPLEAQPTSYEYGSASPYLERTYPHNQLVLGMGQRVQEQGTPRRYSHAINADLSLNGRWIKGPLFTAQTIKAASAVTQIARALYNGVDSIYIAAGRYLTLRLSDGTLTESGTATAGGATTLTKSSAAWTINQWAGNYAITLTGGTGSGQSRIIASNTATAITVDTAWTTNPDATTTYEISAYLKVLDVGTGVTVNQMTRFKDADPTNPLDALYVTCSDGSFWRVRGDVAYTTNVFALRLSQAAIDSGTVTSGGAATLTDTSKTWTIDQWVGRTVELTAGVGSGESRTVLSNTATQLTMSANWTAPPEVPAGGTATAGGASTLSDSTKTWTINRYASLMVTLTGGTGSGQTRTIASNTATQLTVSVPWSTNPDATTTYTITPATAYRIGAIGTSLGYASYVETIGDELWIGHNNKIQKCEADPSVPTNWAGEITIGSADTSITWLRQNHNGLFIFKSNGVYTVGVDGEDQELYPGLRTSPSPDNGKNAAVWLDSLWAPFRDGFYRIEPDGSLAAVGTEQLLDNASEVRGKIVGFVGHNTWFGYLPLYNAHLNNTYLMKYGSWVEEDADGQRRDVLRQKAVYHGALKKWAGKRATSVEILSFTADNDRLYVGFADGTIEFCVLPSNGPNPVGDTACDFTLDDAEVYIPAHHAGFQADTKELHGFSIFGPDIEPSNWAEVYYATDPQAAAADRYTVMRADADATTLASGTDGTVSGNTLTSASAAFNSATHIGRVILINGFERVVRTVTSGTVLQFSGQPMAGGSGLGWSLYGTVAAKYTISGQRTDFQSANDVHAKVIYVKVLMGNEDTDQTPILDGVAIHEAIHPAFILQYEFQVKAHNNVARRDGSVTRRRADTIYDTLKDAVALPGTVECWLPTGEHEDLSFIEFDPQLRPNDRRSGIEYDIGLKAIQYRTLSTPGSLVNTTGFTYETLELYTYGELESSVL